MPGWPTSPPRRPPPDDARRVTAPRVRMGMRRGRYHVRSWAKTPNASRSSPNGSRRRRSTFDVDRKRAQADELEKAASAPDLWEDPPRAQDLTTRLARLRS